MAIVSPLETLGNKVLSKRNTLLDNVYYAVDGIALDEVKNNWFSEIRFNKNLTNLENAINSWSKNYVGLVGQLSTKNDEYVKLSEDKSKAFSYIRKLSNKNLTGFLLDLKNDLQNADHVSQNDKEDILFKVKIAKKLLKSLLAFNTVFNDKNDFFASTEFRVQGLLNGINHLVEEKLENSKLKPQTRRAQLKAQRQIERNRIKEIAIESTAAIASKNALEKQERTAQKQAKAARPKKSIFQKTKDAFVDWKLSRHSENEITANAKRAAIQAVNEKREARVNEPKPAKPKRQPLTKKQTVIGRGVAMIGAPILVGLFAFAFSKTSSPQSSLPNQSKITVKAKTATAQLFLSGEKNIQTDSVATAVKDLKDVNRSSAGSVYADKTITVSTVSSQTPVQFAQNPKLWQEVVTGWRESTKTYISPTWTKLKQDPNWGYIKRNVVPALKSYIAERANDPEKAALINDVENPLFTGNESAFKESVGGNLGHWQQKSGVDNTDTVKAPEPVKNNVRVHEKPTASIDVASDDDVPTNEPVSATNKTPALTTRRATVITPEKITPAPQDGSIFSLSNGGIEKPIILQNPNASWQEVGFLNVNSFLNRLTDFGYSVGLDTDYSIRYKDFGNQLLINSTSNATNHSAQFTIEQNRMTLKAMSSNASDDEVQNAIGNFLQLAATNANLKGSPVNVKFKANSALTDAQKKAVINGLKDNGFTIANENKIFLPKNIVTNYKVASAPAGY